MLNGCTSAEQINATLSGMEAAGVQADEVIVDAVFASLTDDHGEEARRYAEFVLRVQARAAAADAPRTADLQPAREPPWRGARTRAPFEHKTR